MQNSQLPQKEFDPIADFIVRLKVAYRVLTAKQVIVCIDNQLDIFNMREIEVIAVASQIEHDMSKKIYQDISQTAAINKLVYSN